MLTLVMDRAENPASFGRQIEKMFSAIAPRYDFLNRLLSCGRDRYWRKKAVSRLKPAPGHRILDVATGTADVALEIARQTAGKDVKVAGLDFSEKMLELAQRKIDSQGLSETIQLQCGSAENLPFDDGGFDGATTAFGVRNFSNVELGLREMYRVLKPGGRCVILEFALPRHFLFKLVYRVYFDYLLPLLGRMISKHRHAYSYLSESVASFPVRDGFASLLQQAGFNEVTFKELTFGIVIIYTGKKK